MRKENDPRKKVSNLRRLDPNSALEHEIWAVNSQTGERYKLGNYKPLDQQRVKEIEGRLGNILHHKPGLLLGIPADGWYAETRAFLAESLEYLESVYSRNTPFFTFEGIDNVEMVPVERGDAG